MTQLSTLSPLPPVDRGNGRAYRRRPREQYQSNLLEYTGLPQLPRLETLPTFASEADRMMGERRRVRRPRAVAERRQKLRLDPEDPATYEQLRPTIDRITKTSSTWKQLFGGLMGVLDVVDIPRMATNKLLNLVVGAKTSSPDPSILGGERVYGADMMRHFGVKSRAGQMVGGFIWDVLTDPLTWITGVGGILRASAKLAIGKKSHVLLKGVATETRRLVDKQGAGKGLRYLAETAGIDLGALPTVQKAATALGRTDDLARWGAMAGEAAPGMAARSQGALKAMGEVDQFVTELAKSKPSLAGNIYDEIVQRGGMARGGLRASTAPLRGLPGVGKVARAVLPPAESRELIRAGAIAASPRIAGAMVGGMAGAGVGGAWEERGARGGAIAGAVAGALLGPRIAASPAVGRLTANLRGKFISAPRTGVAQLHQRFLQLARSQEMQVGKVHPLLAGAEVAEFKEAVKRLTGIELANEHVGEMMTAAAELRQTRPEDLPDLLVKALVRPVEGAKALEPNQVRRLVQAIGQADKHSARQVMATGLAADSPEWLELKGFKGVFDHPDFADILDKMGNRQAARLAAEQAAGVPVSELSSDAVNYAHHLMIQDETAKQAGLWRAVQRQFGRGKKQAFQMHRKLRDKSAVEINLAYAAKNEGRRLFTENPVLWDTYREIQHTRAMGSALFLRETAERYGQLVPAGQGVPEGLTKLRLQSRFFDGIKDFAFEPDVAEFFQGLDKIWKQPGAILQLYDKALSTMKGWMLIAPAFHSRNVGTNIYMSMAGDGYSLAGHTHGLKALLAQRFAKGSLDKLVVINKKALKHPATGKGLTYGGLVELADERGLLQRGFMALEAGGDVTDDIMRDVAQGVAPKNWHARLRDANPLQLARLNRAVGSYLEDSSKLAHVITRLSKGDTIDQAVAGARRYLFDYSQLTSFEQGTMKRLFPFYTWARKNFGLQLELLLERPEWTAMYPKIKGDIEASLGEGQLPAALRGKYVRREAGIQLSGGTRPLFMNLAGFLPLAELRLMAGTGKGLFSEGVNALNPMITMPVESALNRSFFWEEPIRKAPGQRVPFLGGQIPPEVRHWASWIRPLGEVDRIVRGFQRQESAAAIGGRLTGLRIFTGNVPREIARFQRELGERKGYMRSQIRINLANGNIRGAERMVEIFEQQEMPEDALKGRMMIAQARSDFGLAKELALELAAMQRERRAAEMGPTAIRELARAM